MSIVDLKLWIRLQVAFVAIGATMVGSISFSKKEGDYVKKGDEVHDSWHLKKFFLFHFILKFELY